MVHNRGEAFFDHFSHENELLEPFPRRRPRSHSGDYFEAKKNGIITTASTSASISTSTNVSTSTSSLQAQVSWYKSENMRNTPQEVEEANDDSASSLNYHYNHHHHEEVEQCHERIANLVNDDEGFRKFQEDLRNIRALKTGCGTMHVLQKYLVQRAAEAEERANQPPKPRRRGATRPSALEDCLVEIVKEARRKNEKKEHQQREQEIQQKFYGPARKFLMSLTPPISQIVAATTATTTTTARTSKDVFMDSFKELSEIFGTDNSLDVCVDNKAKNTKTPPCA